jgi:multifunctional beta-oxidation protein
MSSFKNMSDKEWDQVHEVHLKGAYSCTHAAWPIFRKQKFGRIVNTASAAGLFGERPALFRACVLYSYLPPVGNFGQTNYSAAKMGLVAFTKTLALEGAKYNIKVNAIAPVSARVRLRYPFLLNLCLGCCLCYDGDYHATRDVATPRRMCSPLK